MIIKLFTNEKVRYLATGGSSAGLEYASFLALSTSTKALIFANVVSFMIGLIYSFTIHKIWTFRGDHSNNTKRQFVAYSILAVVNILLTSVLIDLQVEGLLMPSFIAKLVCMGLVVLWNYLLLNKLIFKKLN